jgi:hypothetical protein
MFFFAFALLPYFISMLSMGINQRERYGTIGRRRTEIKQHLHPPLTITVIMPSHVTSPLPC